MNNGLDFASSRKSTSLRDKPGFHRELHSVAGSFVSSSHESPGHHLALKLRSPSELPTDADSLECLHVVGHSISYQP